MSVLEKLPTLESFEATVRKEAISEARDYVKRARERVKERIEKLKQVREAVTKLEAAGFTVSDYYTTYAHVHLGFFPTDKVGNAQLVEAVRKVRLAMGCKLNNEGLELQNAEMRRVRYTLKPANYQSVYIHFDRRLPRKGAKCRIVTHRSSSYKTLVCDR